MTRTCTTLALVVLGFGGLAAAHAADPPDKPVCEPGYTLVEEIQYREVVRKVCRLVPETKKVPRTVYEVKVVDYCQQKCPNPLACLKHKGEPACCGDCGKPRTRKVLVKKEVVDECPGYKCVVEEVVERVPCVVYRKVRCGEAPR